MPATVVTITAVPISPARATAFMATASAIDQLDFEGWNGPDGALFRHLHTDDVTVEVMGQRTKGLQAHLEMCQQPRRAEP